MEKITMGSLFSGSGGFELAGSMYGITPIWASEIEPFPVKVTETRFPDMEHLGDISRLNGTELDPVDIVTGGSPCQDMSIAGKREGLNGARSSLFHEQIRIVKEMREVYGKPRFMVWENVPGAFSSNKGQDFRAVLEAIAGVKQPGITIPEPERKDTGGLKWNTAGTIVGDGYSIAWRVFDAQYWGVAQRRKRIYLVADFDGGCAGKILFKPDSLPWDFEKSAEAWQRAAGSIKEGWEMPESIVPEIYGTIERKEDGTLYTTKAQRTGCSMCGFGIHLEKRPHRFDQLKERNPKEWEYWMFKCCVDEETGEKFGWSRVLDYIGVDYL